MKNFHHSAWGTIINGACTLRVFYYNYFEVKGEELKCKEFKIWFIGRADSRAMGSTRRAIIENFIK